MQVYQKLKKLRQSLGLRQVDMASGVVDVSFYSRIERGEVKIRAINLIELLQAQNVSLMSVMKDGGVVDQSIDSRQRHGLIGEDRVPRAEGLVGGD